MQFNVKLSKAPFSARKARLVVDLVRGKNVNSALEILQFTHKRPAKYLTKLLRSCIANVEHYNAQEANRNVANVDSDELVVSEIRVDEGPLVGYRRRWKPRARGMALPINKRTCHMRVALAELEGAEAGEREEEKAAVTEEKKVVKPESEEVKAAEETKPAEAKAEESETTQEDEE